MLSAMEHDTPPLGTNPDPDPDNHRPPRPCRLRRLAIGLALGITTAGVPTFGIVTTSGASGTDDASAADEVVAVNVSTGDCNADALPADVVASINDDEDALAAFLDERGITSTRETDTDGMRWVAWDEEDDAANTAVDQFYAEHYPLSPEELAQMNAEEDALAAFLDQQGITYTRQPGPDGVNYVAWDEEDDAANTAVDHFYTSSSDACVVSVP